MCNCNGQCKKERFVIADELLDSFEAGYNIGKDHGEEEATETFVALFESVENDIRDFLCDHLDVNTALSISAHISYIFQKKVWNKYGNNENKGGTPC